MKHTQLHYYLIQIKVFGRPHRGLTTIVYSDRIIQYPDNSSPILLLFDFISSNPNCLFPSCEACRVPTQQTSLEDCGWGSQQWTASGSRGVMVAGARVKVKHSFVIIISIRNNNAEPWIRFITEWLSETKVSQVVALILFKSYPVYTWNNLNNKMYAFVIYVSINL